LLVLEVAHSYLLVSKQCKLVLVGVAFCIHSFWVLHKQVEVVVPYTKLVFEVVCKQAWVLHTWVSQELCMIALEVVACKQA